MVLLKINDEVSKPILRKAQFLLQQLIEIGVGYLSLERSVGTLSGGESQRVKMSKQMDCDLVDMLYVLDEPTTGLHMDDVKRLMEVLHALVDTGNSMIIIEHNLDVIKSADYIIDMGPEGGAKGGYVIAKGTPEEVAKNPKSYTGKFLSRLL